MPSEASNYPGALDIFADQEAKKDKASKAVINRIQNAIEALEGELGTDPAGSVTDVKTRLYVCIDNDGTLRKGTSFPASPVDGQPFWRTDEDALYINNGSSWIGISSLSVLAFIFGMSDTGVTISPSALCVSASSEPTPSTDGKWLVYAVHQSGNVYRTITTHKFKKIAGNSTITVYARCWRKASTAQTGTFRCTIGSASGNTTFSSASPTWINFTIDISGLSTGTVYDVTFEMRSDDGGGNAQVFCDAFIGFAS